MQVRLLKEWRGYRPGSVFEYGAGPAVDLIRRGIVEPVRTTDVETTTNEPQAERAVAIETVKRKRGRPRKMP